MIVLTRLNGEELYVRETPEDVVDLVGGWFRGIHAGAVRVTDGGA